MAMVLLKSRRHLNRYGLAVGRICISHQPVGIFVLVVISITTAILIVILIPVFFLLSLRHCPSSGRA